ncbi:MAG: Ni/Fe hydrogenase subunit alpha [Verrucomicrobiota bacterium]|nr:Ni/Fe hydrogenase subunit alpha [Verrucomicrobiota bacterium]
MGQTLNIDVHHITRVEGHGNIVARARDGKVQKVEWQAPEAPRFFEAMVRGRRWDEIQPIVSRICGICSVSHSLVAIKALENAMGIEVSEQTDKLRLLLDCGEQLESHVLHVGYLVAPDLLGVKSVIPLVASHPSEVKTIVAAHRVGNAIMEVIGGRMTHPVSAVPGGFARLPTEQQLRDLKKQIEETVPRLEAIAGVVLSVAGKLPAFDRPTEYIALVEPKTYTFYHGKIGSTDTRELVDVHNFESVANEYVSPQSTAKWTKWHRDSYAVGALARFNLNAAHLRPLAAQTAKTFGLKPDCCNPYMNSVAQVVESAQVVEHALQLIDELLTRGIKPEPVKVTPKAGNGAAAVEAPRGILFHRYVFDKAGICERANICIPTGQNHANIQKDFEALVPAMMDRGQDYVRQALEMLVRSYDPCISCSTHYLDVQFV